MHILTGQTVLPHNLHCLHNNELTPIFPENEKRKITQNKKSLRTQKYRSYLPFVFLTLLFCVVGGIFFSMNACAELILTQEEQDYIARGNILKAVSVDGGAPLHYLDSKGRVRGVAVRVLDEIANMTGLIFEYHLYDSIQDTIYGSINPDIVFGVTTQYAVTGMILSQPYLKSETILYINSSIDPYQLEDKVYAGIEGGTLPEGVKEENAVYFNSREDTLTAVDKGKADYGYGNPFSVAFYTLQNGYRDIITIPIGKEIREYCMGFLKENELLLSIINKSIEAIDENRLQMLVLEETSRIDRKISLEMIIEAYGREIATLILLITGVLWYSAILNIRTGKKLKIENKRYGLLSNISNECLFEYQISNEHLELSEKCSELFGGQEEINEIVNLLKESIITNGSLGTTSTAKLPVANGKIGTFRVINSGLYDDMGKLHSVIGKLIDISEEIAEKEILISKSQLDGLTGLYNAITTKEQIERNIKSQNTNKQDALIVIDIDNFKNINDILGHLQGDQALERIGESLKHTFRQSDIIGRMGGDEFAVYMNDIPSVDFVRSKCQQLSTLIHELNQDLSLPVLISIGIAISTGEHSYDDLFKQADEAMYLSKKKGGAQIVVYGEYGL